METQIDLAVGNGKCLDSDDHSDANTKEIFHGNVGTIKMGEHEEGCATHAIDEYLDRDKGVKEEKRAENKQVHNGDSSDEANEKTSKPPAMEYRGAENLLCLDEDEAGNNALPSPEEVADEAISDLLMSALDQTESDSTH